MRGMETNNDYKLIFEDIFIVENLENKGLRFLKYICILFFTFLLES